MTINNMFVTGGQFVAALIDGILSPYKRIGWRYKNFLLTEFEVCTVSYKPSFFHVHLWPKHEARRP